MKMAERQLFRSLNPLHLSKGNSSQNWKRFRQNWKYYELTTGVATHSGSHPLTVIGDEALDVYKAFKWDRDDDKFKIDKVLEKF